MLKMHFLIHYAILSHSYRYIMDRKRKLLWYLLRITSRTLVEREKKFNNTHFDKLKKTKRVSQVFFFYPFFKRVYLFLYPRNFYGIHIFLTNCLLLLSENDKKYLSNMCFKHKLVYHIYILNIFVWWYIYGVRVIIIILFIYINVRW